MTFVPGTGIYGDGSSGYLDTTFNPSTAVDANYTLNANAFGLYVNGPQYSNAAISVSPPPSVGSNESANNYGLMGGGSSGGGLAAYVYDQGQYGTYDRFVVCANDFNYVDGPSAGGQVAGMLAVSRFNDDVLSAYWNGNVCYAQAYSPIQGSLPYTSIPLGANNYTGPSNIMSGLYPFTFGSATPATTSSAVAAGTMVVLFVDNFGNGTFAGIVDSAANVYTLAVASTYDSVSGSQVQVWTCVITNPLPQGGTFTPAGTGGTSGGVSYLPAVFVVPGASAVDTTTSTTGSGDTLSLSTGTLATTSELVLGFICCGGTTGAVTNTGKFETLYYDGGAESYSGADVSSNASVTWNPSWQTSVSGFSAALVSFKITGSQTSYSGFSSSQMGAAFIGGMLTDTQQATLAAAINAFMETVGSEAWPIALEANASGGVSGAQWSNQVSESPTLVVPAFGINAHVTYNGSVTPTPAQQVAMLQFLGVTNVRIDAVDWAQIEPSYTSPPTYVFPQDALIAALRAAGITVTLALGYSNQAYNFSPYDLDTYYTAPTTASALNAFSSYCAAVVNHYGATGFIYEIWNEWNIGQSNGQFSFSPAATASPWPNTATAIAAYVAMWNAASSAIINGITFNGLTTPGTTGAVIMCGGLAAGGYFTDPYTAISTFLADATLTYLDHVGFHPYGSEIGNGQQPEWSEFQIMPSFNSDRGSYGVDLNEMGYQVQNCNNSETTKAVMNMRGLLALVINGNDCLRIQPYVMVENGDGYGYFDDNFNALPSATAYKNLIAAFSGAIATSVFWLNPYVGYVATGYPSLWEFFFIVIEKSATSYVVIAWPMLGTYELSYYCGGTLLFYSATDLFGNPVPVTNNGNTLTFTCSDVGGPVILSYTT